MQENAPPAAPKRSENRTLMLILSYFGLLALVPLLVEKEDPEVQWHAKHGLILACFWIVLAIALSAISMIPVVGWIFGCGLSALLPIAMLAIHIIAIVKALNGDRLKLPMISDFADQWK